MFPIHKIFFLFRSFIDSLSSFIRSSSLNHCSLVAKCSRRCRATEKTFPKTNDYNDFLRSALLWWKNLNPTREKLLVHLTECFPEASDDDEKDVKRIHDCFPGASRCFLCRTNDIQTC
jgi:hypothetical protein